MAAPEGLQTSWTLEGTARRPRGLSVEIVSFTACRRRPVVDAAGEPVGRLQDLAVQLLGPQPAVTKLVVTTPDREELVLGWDAVAAFPTGPADPVRLREAAARPPAAPPPPAEGRPAGGGGGRWGGRRGGRGRGVRAA